MVRPQKLLPLLLVGILSACTSTNFATGYASAPDIARPEAPGDLASLFTGQIIGEEEQILRDTLNRQIVLDFPIKVGVIYYQLDSKLDSSDRNIIFKDLRQNLADSELVRETVEIPSSLLSGGANIDELRRIGARFQTDILVLISGNHDFSRARSQEISFWDSFSDQEYYESKVNLEAIALDVYTGTLLSPFDASATGEPILLSPGTADFAEKRYQYQKKIETKTWLALGNEAIDNLITLEKEVKRRKAELAAVQDTPETPAADQSTDNTTDTNNETDTTSEGES